MLDYLPLNFQMMRHPYNWIVLILMVSIAGFGLALVFPSVAASPGAATK